ncbi:MAG: transketolase family protein [Chloroflexi bacterium]|nr:transketolase family protein [Chloroflexota bacterium]
MKKVALRDGFGQGLLELGRRRSDVFVLAGDVAESTRAELFQKEFPERFLNMGIAEQDMVGSAVGLSLSGKVVFISSFSCFLCSRGYDQIRVSICYNNQSVKIAGTHAGITVGPDGATAQALEDIALMRALPNMTVVVPADAIEARKATIAAADWPGPIYLRFGRPPVPIITNEQDPFEIGKATIVRQGRDVVLVACGVLVAEALAAAQALVADGVESYVINMHTVKPLDEATLLTAARTAGAVVTAEEHQINGGLGSAVAQVLARNFPCPMEMVAVSDVFGESGEPEDLKEKYGLTWKHIRDKALDLIHAPKLRC